MKVSSQSSRINVARGHRRIQKESQKQINKSSKDSKKTKNKKKTKKAKAPQQNSSQTIYPSEWPSNDYPTNYPTNQQVSQGQEDAELDGLEFVDTSSSNNVFLEKDFVEMSAMVDSNTYRLCSNAHDGFDDKNSTGKKEIISFDYELVVPDGLNSSAILIDLEIKILDYIAGSLECGIIGPTSVTEAKKNSSDPMLSLLSLDLNPLDNINYNVSCIIPYPKPDNTTEFQCLPISGFMSAQICHDCLYIETTVLQLIKSGMDDGYYTSDSILQTSFIGKRQMAEPSNPKMYENKEATNPVAEYSLITGFWWGVLGIFLLLLVLVMRKTSKMKKMRKEREAEAACEREISMKMSKIRPPICQEFSGEGSARDIGFEVSLHNSKSFASEYDESDNS